MLFMKEWNYMNKNIYLLFSIILWFCFQYYVLNLSGHHFIYGCM